MQLAKYIYGSLFFLASSNLYASSCEEIAQCDTCSTDGQFQQAALDASPPIPPGEDLLQCVVFVANLDSSEARVYTVDKGEEPGFSYAWASESTMTTAEEDAFDDFFAELNAFEASPKDITIPSSVADSAYQLPASTYLRGQVGNYIDNNLGAWNLVYGALGGVASLVDNAFVSFSQVLTVTVNFSDGSSGEYRVVVLGLGNSEWQIVEESFTDGDGNEIFFDADDYAGQSGPIAPGAASFLANRLIGGGWSVAGNYGSSGALSCNWNCEPDSGGSEGTRCTVSCSTE